MEAALAKVAEMQPPAQAGRWAEARPKVAPADGRGRSILPCQGRIVG